MKDDGTAAVENRILKSQIAALEQLLDVYETSVLKNTGELFAEIARRKQAEETLRESHRLIEGILNAIPVRVFWKDKNLVYLGCC